MVAAPVAAITTKLIRNATYWFRFACRDTSNSWLVAPPGTGRSSASQRDRDRDHGVGEEDEPLGRYELDLRPQIERLHRRPATRLPDHATIIAVYLSINGGG
jgi:hypothetical protein